MAEFLVEYDNGSSLTVTAGKYEYDHNRESYVFIEEGNEVAAIPKLGTNFVGKKDAIRRING